MPVANVYLGLGSNLGDRKLNLALALGQCALAGMSVLKVSSLIETEAVGGPPQGRFLNAAALIQTSLSPQDLLSRLKNIEQQLGRDLAAPRNSPRPIDLDILLYDEQTIETANLVIPHPRMRERPFVMIPLLEIYPDLKAWKELI